MIGGWDQDSVVQAQADWTEKELLSPQDVLPFRYFQRAMEQVGFLDGRTLLDVGCGVGHYGALCEKYYPGIRYVGTDASAAMIETASRLRPGLLFKQVQFEDNLFWGYEIVLLSQVLEMLEDPWMGLNQVLFKFTGYIIWNRIRLTPETSHSIEEQTYAGYTGRNYLWNLVEIRERLVPHFRVWEYPWRRQDSMTILIHR